MKHGYRYFQRGEKTPWITIPAEGAEAAALEQGAVRLTVLSTSKALGGLDGEAVPKDVRFYGPLYFDIDHKEDLALAIESANRLVTRLVEEYGVDPSDIQAFLSGSKGLHLFLLPHTFGLERPVLRLPGIYREMAKQLYVSGMDMQPYSMRNAFRLPNVKRDDGRFRVGVSIAELRELTVERYRELVAKPRPDFRHPDGTGKVYVQLSVLFESATELAKKNEKVIQDSSQVYAPVLRQHFSIDAPPCIQSLAEGKKAETASFNQVATQVAIFAARLNADGLGTFEPTFDRIADNQQSSSYSSARARREHMEGQYAYMRSTERYNFSCNAMRSVLKGRPCDECPLEAVKVVDSPESAAQAVGIAARADGYFDVAAQGKPRRISTFILEPEYVYNQLMEDGQVRRVGTVAQVKTNGQSVGRVLLDESSWGNRQQFLRALGGFSNLSFLGSETDIQKIKYVTMADDDLPEKQIVREMGMHVTRVNDKEIRTYVEAGKSINSLKLRDTYNFDGSSLYEPFLLSAKRMTQGDEEARRALKHLLHLNEPGIMGPLVGWVAACHLKPHLMHLYRQFPPLNLWGNMSVGKTTTARFACVLGGVDFIGQHEEMNVAASSPYAWLDSLSNSTSIPIIWDELNKTKDRMTPKLYAKACELLKATFNGQAANKGALGSTNSGSGTSAVVVSYRMVRPVIYCSEQQPDVSALNDRSVNLLVTKKGKEGRRNDVFELRASLDGLKRAAHTMMLNALTTPTVEVAKMFRDSDALMADGLSERPRYGLACCHMGLRWLRSLAEQYDLVDEELGALMDEAEAAVVEHAKQLGSEESTREISTEVDRAFAEILEVIDNSLQAEHLGGTPLLHRGIHFAVDTTGGYNWLHLDVRAAHSAYMMWARRKGVNVVLDDLRNFCRLAKLEEYVNSMVNTPAVLGGRHAFVIDLARAHKRGLPVNLLGAELREF